MRIAPVLLSILTAGAATAGAHAQGEPPWQALFDGKTLSGWVQRGGKARYTALDGAIVGTTVPETPNSFLCTEKAYGDFALELEFRIDDALNSGVQIRSAARDDGRVHGYQVEIDPSDRAWSAGIYDEAGRGWLAPLAADSPARQAFRHGAWNHCRIVCLGDWLRTWINGVPAADLRDPMASQGFIALQVHGIGKQEDELQVRWRDIRLRDLGRHRWVSICDGSSLDGWREIPGGTWRLEDRVLIGTHTAAEPRHGILLSEQRYGDFTARIVYRAALGNSGFYFRAEPVAGDAGVHGLQAEIDPAENGGMLYETGGRGRVAVPDAELVAKAFKPDQWNAMVVSAHGGRVTVHLNGCRVTELRADPGRAEGHFGIQLHGGQDVQIEVERIELLVPDS